MKPISETLSKFRALAAELRATLTPPKAIDPVRPILEQLAEAPELPPTRLSIYEDALWGISQQQSGVPAVRALALLAQEALREGKKYV